MPIHTDNTIQPKKRIKEKPNVNLSVGSNYIDIYNNQNGISAFSGVAMDSSDTIYVNSLGTHLAEESALIAEFGSVPSTYTEVDIILDDIPEVYVEDIDHYEAWN